MTDRRRKTTDCVVRFAGCPHASYFPDSPPNVGDEVYCQRCRAYRIVAETHAEYMVKCDTPGCRTPARKFGAALLTAQRWADRHAREHPDHSLLILQGSQVVEERRGKRGQNVLPLGLYDAPF